MVPLSCATFSFLLHVLLHASAPSSFVAYADSATSSYTTRPGTCQHQFAESQPQSGSLGGSSLLQRDYHRSSVDNLQDLEQIHSGDGPKPSLLLQHGAMEAKSNESSQQTADEKWMLLSQKQQDVQELARRLELERAELKRLQEEQKADEIRIDPTEKPKDKHDEHSVFVPFPYFLHDKEHTLQHGLSAYGYEIIGDPLDPTLIVDKNGKEYVAKNEQKHGHGRGYIVLLFLGGSLVIGCVLQMLLQTLPLVPYTCGLFLVGIFVSWVHWLNQDRSNFWHWHSWYDSVEMWQNIDPHLLFYAFLPALLFGDVVKSKVQLVRVSAGQIFMLACPGVLFGCLLIATFAKFVFPYNWEWPISFVFGSILSATDPVAVVSLFNTLGVSERLTMLVSGESLVNDGTAIVCFGLALKVTLGATLVPHEVAIFFAHMLVTATVAGILVGLLSVNLIVAVSEDHKHHDSMIQVVVTICCGYLAFFMSESELSSSGVIATVSAGICIAHSCWPLFVSRETVLTVWEAIEFIGNTVIFFLAGLIFGGTLLEEKSYLKLVDVAWLLLLYVSIFAIRALMLAVFWLPLNMVGSHLSWQEGFAMVWSGLRGAVSVAMSMIVVMEPHIHKDHRAQVLFHVGGVALLTLLINSTTSAVLLRGLGLVQTKQMMARMDARFSAHLAHKITESFEKLRHSQDRRFNGANKDLVCAMVPALQIMAPRFFPSRDQHDNRLQWKLLQSYREIFLRVVQSRYWKGIHDGVIPRHLRVSRILLQSADEAMDKTWDSLNDWDIIARNVNIEPPTKFQQFLSNLVDFPAVRHIYSLSSYSLEYQTMMHVYIALSYVDAHEYAQAMIPKCWGTDDALDFRVQKQVINESNMQINKVSALIAKLPTQAVESGRSKMLARKLLIQQCHEIEELREEGIIGHAEADHLSEPCLAALRDIARLRSGSWQERVEAVQYNIASSNASTPSQPAPHEPVRYVTGLPAASMGSDSFGTATATFGLPEYKDTRVSVPVIGSTIQQTRQSLPPSSDPGAALRPGSSLHQPLGTEQVVDPGVVLHPGSLHEGDTNLFTGHTSPSNR